ncbi:MAG: polysaccharide biosynthesis C-terminal domain-containing protein, partial [Candidatus Moranbacteria bacterium]|nr:polysaccharide biosynthesis C-terminal domain-containing protein [Candidatus Moranbacteria bacterium]
KIGLIPIIKKQTAKIQFILIGAVTVIFFFLAPVISFILHDKSLTPLFQLSTLVIPAFALASFYFYYYTGLHEFKTQAWLKTSRSFARLLFILGLALLLKSRGYALEGAIIGYILAPLSIYFEANALDKFKKVKPEGFFDWRKLLQYAWPMTLFLIAYEFLITIDLYLVKGILRDDTLTGLYNGAITVGRIPYFLFYALTIIILPAVSKSTSSNNHTETKKLIGQSLRLMVMFLLPISILMAVYSRPVLQIFYGNKFLAAAGPMSILMGGVTFLTIFYVMAFALNGAGKVKAPMYIAFAGLATNIILSYFLIHQYGLTGAAVATSITSLVAMVLVLAYSYNFFGYLFKLSSFLKILFASAIMYFVSIFFPEGKYIFLLWSAILFAIYILILFALKEFGASDLELVKQLLAKKKLKTEADVEEEAL